MTKCKTILWFQGETATQKDTLLIDGKDAESVGERDDAFNFIIKGRENGNRLLSTINRGAIKVGNRLLKSYELSQIKHKMSLLPRKPKCRFFPEKELTNSKPTLTFNLDYKANPISNNYTRFF